MRPHPPLRLAASLLAVTACTRSGDASSSFSGGPGPGTGSPGSEGSSDTGTSSSSSGSGQVDVSTGAASSTGSFDVGAQPDFVPPPAGCKGKIDFLFLVSRAGLMMHRQAQLAAAFPDFIDTIESQFADFDYHIMVVDGDGGPASWWGSQTCNELCPELTCKVGDACCGWYDPDYEDEPCCQDPNYPCEALDTLTPCDTAWGAGTVFPAGPGTADKPCPIDDSRRFIAKGQTDLDETFACIATVGVSGYSMLGQALTAAVDPQINGGCNNGFLRPDALLMVTLISNLGDNGGGVLTNSEGTPAEWAQAVIDAKHGDDRSVVMLNIGIGVNECTEPDGLCRLAAMFPFHHLESITTPDFGPAFAEAADLVDEACAMFVPPPG